MNFSLIDHVVGTRPLYEQIYKDLERKILTGEIRYMEQLPVLPELCRQYGVSEAPVRRALDDLARDGLIIRRRGRGQGTFAVKRLTRLTVRVLLLAGIDIYRNSIETCYEVFDLFAGIREAAAELDCDVRQVSPDGFDNLAPIGADTGYLVIGMSRADYEVGLQLAQSHHAPCVLVNPPYAQHPCVRVDIEQGAFLGVNYLAQLGHRRIAYVGSARSEWLAPRFDGYRRALAAGGLEVDVALVQETNGIDPEQDWQALDALMAIPSPPTAIFACSDYRAIHLLTHCKRRGIQVPQDLSICGYDDIDEVRYITPALTTVRHPRGEQGRPAMELLIDLLAGKSNPSKDRVLPSEVIVRSSCTTPRR